MSSFDLREQLEAIKHNIETYVIANDHDVSSMDRHEVDDLLSRAVDAISQDFANVTDDETLDIYRSILKAVTTSPRTVPPALMTKVLDSLESAFTAAADDTSKHVDEYGPEELRDRRQVLETYAFLLYWFVSGAEKYKGTMDAADGTSAAPKPRRGRGGKAAAGGRTKKNAEWTWVEQIKPTLDLIVNVLKIRSHRIWTTSADRETLLEALMDPVYAIMANEAYMKFDSIQANIFQAICLAVKNHNDAKRAQANLLRLLGESEGLADPVADIISILAKDQEQMATAEAFLRDVSKQTWASGDNTGPKSFSRFLIRLVDIAPRLVLKELNALQTFLDNDAYQMRNAIVEIFGALIKDQLQTNEDLEQAETTISGLYVGLLQRTRDTSSYVRSRVFQVFVKVLDVHQNGHFVKQRLKIVEKCYFALMDKTATVRKYALACLQKVIQTHTYKTVEDDGTECYDLQRDAFQERYDMFSADEKAHKAELKALSKANEPAGDAEPQADEPQEAQTPKNKRPKKRRSNGADDMDVDGEDAEGGDADEDDDADSIISGEGEGQSREDAEEDITTLDLSALDEAQQVRANHEIDKIAIAQKYRKYYAEALGFITAIEATMERACTLLGSKSKAEVLEAIELFRVAYMYKMPTAEDGMRKMIHLIWQKDNNAPPTTTGEEVVSTKGVRTRLIDTYDSIYFTPQKQVPQSKYAKEVAKQLIVLTYSMSLAELTSLEELVRQMVDEGRVDSEVIETLWLVYEDKRALPLVQRRGAIILLGMFALSKPSIVRSKQSILLEIGLGKYGKTDLQLAKYTCIALQRMTGVKKKVKGSLEDNRQRYAMSNPVFRRLIDVLEAPTHDRAWFAFAEQALNAVYDLAEKPEVVAEKVIRDLTRRAFASAPAPADMGGSAQPPPEPEQEKPQEEKDPDAMETDDEEGTPKPKAADLGEEDRAATPQPQAAPGPSQASAIPGGDAGDAFGLSQMFFVVGHVAMKHIVHLELIEREMKRKKQEQEQAAKQGATQAEKEDEIEQVAGNAEDDIGEHIKHVREEELLFGDKSLLKVYGPLLVYVCGSPQIYKDATLRAAATLSFAKFLCISGKFCEEHHMLLFKILETSRDPNIRANIVIGIGDLAVSFATIIDERLNDLYMGLGADELIVKKNTLMVLTHLILNGMIKVKGQLAEMAKCIEDKEERVSDLAKLFFNELSTKDNAIYNNLPDMISHLSMGKFAVSEEVFQNTMKFIFGFVEKERQAENIVEKLCQRFKLAPEPRQWRDIAFCLSLLPFRSERSLQKLISGLPHYKDKLHDEGVYNRFVEILGKVKLAKKNEQEITEFEKILDDNRQKGEEDQEFERQVEKNKAKAKKRATKKEKAAGPAPAKRATRTRKKAAAHAEDEMDEDE